MPLPVRRPPLPLLLSLACAYALASSGCGDATLTVHKGLATGRAADSLVIYDCLGRVLVAPVELALDCYDRWRRVVALKWRNWGRPRATATGLLRCSRCARRSAPIRLEARSIDVDGTRVAYRLLTLSLQQPPDGRPGRRFWLRYAVFDGILLRPRQ